MILNVLKAPQCSPVLTYRTFTSSQHLSLSNPKPKTPLLCPIQSEDLLLLSQPESGRGDRSVHPQLSSYGVDFSPSPLARRFEQYSRFSALFSVNAAQPRNYLSLNTFGFHPAFSSSSLLSASSAFRTSLSILSRALSTLLCR